MNPSNMLGERLIEWFAAHARRLPWRQARPHGAPRDPYRVWIAEIMLQQTRVETVIPYYSAFLTRFPTVRSLADASLDDVLKAWEGLGYYARARHLHQAARLVQSRHAGHIPADRAALLALPGIGVYTAGAILSLAFGQDALALDANARRVLARLYLIAEPLKKPAVAHQLETLALTLLPTGQAGIFNEALMDLGALICTPRAPACSRCPWRDFCQAHLAGRVNAIPYRSPWRSVPHYQVAAAVICEYGKFLLTQRRNDQMLGGLWEFPGGKCENGESLPACLQREIREELGLDIEVGERVAIVKHSYTHMRITLHAFLCQRIAGEPQALQVQDWCWVSLANLERFALSVADQRVAAALRQRAELPTQP